MQISISVGVVQVIARFSPSFNNARSYIAADRYAIGIHARHLCADAASHSFARNPA
jgi:hypothetical protein